MRASALLCQPAHCDQALNGRAIKTTAAATRVISDRTTLGCGTFSTESTKHGRPAIFDQLNDGTMWRPACFDFRMAQTVGDFLIERLSGWGVTRVYGYPGDGINGIMGALERAADRMRFIQVRHEEMAAFMACAHAKFTGEVGVC